MTWPDWGDVLPTLALLVGLAGSVAGAFWALLRMFQPVAEMAARDAVDTLYERLRANDFKHVGDALIALGDRIDRMREDVGGRLEQSETRFGERLEEVDTRLSARLEEVDTRLSARLDRADKRLEDGLDRARTDRREMEARLLAAIRERGGPEPFLGT